MNWFALLLAYAAVGVVVAVVEAAWALWRARHGEWPASGYPRTRSERLALVVGIVLGIGMRGVVCTLLWPDVVVRWVRA